MDQEILASGRAAMVQTLTLSVRARAPPHHIHFGYA